MGRRPPRDGRGRCPQSFGPGVRTESGTPRVRRGREALTAGAGRGLRPERLMTQASHGHSPQRRALLRGAPVQPSVAYTGVCESLAASESPGAVRCPPLEPLSVHCAGQREKQPPLRDDAEAEAWETTRPTSRLPDAHSALATRGPQSAGEDVLLLRLGVSSLFRKEAGEPLSLSGHEETSASFLGPDDSQAAALPAAPRCSLPGTWPHLILPAALRDQEAEHSGSPNVSCVLIQELPISPPSCLLIAGVPECSGSNRARFSGEP
ncbi:uncharacterized protein [Eschrichtius robustus]|uniref:uncharacterized protein n=1 Tax=Eschrichtius robustus TaxID=9764 RepID=UPI0035C07DCA